MLVIKVFYTLVKYTKLKYSIQTLYIFQQNIEAETSKGSQSAIDTMNKIQEKFMEVNIIYFCLIALNRYSYTFRY